MTRDEWYTSKKFLLLRLTNQMSHNMRHELQRLYDVVALLNAECENGLGICDKFNLLVRQMRVVGLELDELIGDSAKLDSLLSPSKFDEENKNDKPPRDIRPDEPIRTRN